MGKEDQKINFRRISDQAALIQNIDKMKSAPGGTYNVPEWSVYVSGLEISNAEQKEVDGISVNKLYNFKKFIEQYNKLTPASLSLLNPYIEIYKIYEDESQRLIPFNNFFPKASLDAITNSRSDRGYQANIQSIKIASQGKDTATAFIYTVQMKFIFDSVQTLFNDNSKYIELFNPPKKYKFKRGSGEQKYYQIKLKFGWNVNTQGIQSNLNPTSVKDFADASSSEIFLNYIKHTIGINEDGSVSLNVEYVGSLELEARDPNKFCVLTSKNIERLKEIAEQISNIEDSLTKNGLKPEPTTDKDKINIKILDDQKNEVQRPERQQLEQLYNEKKEKEGNDEKEFREGIIKNILLQFGTVFDENGQVVTNTLAKKLPVFVIDEQVYSSRRSLFEAGNIGVLESNSKVQQLIKLENQQENAFIKYGIQYEDEEEQDIKNHLNKLEFSEDTVVIEDRQDNKKYYRIPFFTFRNLLKSLQSLYGKDNKESNFIMLGTEIFIAKFKTGELIDPKTLAENPEYITLIDNGLSLGKNNQALIENKLEKINILDIPIALSTFKYWFNKNISSQNITNMSLKTFLELCINDLLVLCVNPVNSDYVPRQNITFKMSMDKITINKNNKLLKEIQDNQGSTESIQYNKGYTLLEEQIKTSEAVNKNVVIFYAVPKHNTRISNIKKDLEDGIPHFFYGQNKGIVNKITFREENIPFFKEANIQSQVDRKPWRPGIFLRSKYNVVIEMIGTVNFRVGSMVYVSPSFPGVINTAEPIDYGIGGYFIIVSINTEIESGKYTTILECNWVATGTGEYTDLSHLPFKVVTLPRPLEYIRAAASKTNILIQQSARQKEQVERIKMGDTAFSRKN
jgi:hypothetical protein